jgi:ABC-2 type transport system ATP-binding protein
MTVSKYLRFRAKLKGEQSKKISHRVEEAMEICRLSAYADSRIGLLSRGQMKRVALADVFLLRPRYVILDDPYAGLDDLSREALCNVIRNVSSFASVIAAGHEVEEFSKWANVKYEMRAGQLSDLSENEKPKGVEM